MSTPFKTRGRTHPMMAMAWVAAAVACQLAACDRPDGPSTWTTVVDPIIAAQEATLVASAGAADANVGFSVGLSSDGSRAIVGAPFENNSSGRARIFLRSGSSWTEEAILVPTNGTAGANFGHSVALSGDGSRAIVGAIFDGTGGVVPGSARVFLRTGTTWTEEAKLVASDAEDQDYFGYSVALSSNGSRAIVGALFDEGVGSARVFLRTGTSWAEEATLAGTKTGTGFSVALASDGSRAIVGAPFDEATENGTTGGNAHVFLRSGTSWDDEATLVASGGAGSDGFGRAVALSSDGSRALIGAYLDNSAEGSARVFLRTGTTWDEESTLNASDGAADDLFGYSVALSSDGSRAVIGAPLHDTAAGIDVGSAYAFSRTGTTWDEDAPLVASDGEEEDLLGIAVALSSDGGRAIVGAPLDDTAGGGDAGSVRAFTLADGTPVATCTGPCDVDLRGGISVENGLRLTFEGGINKAGDLSVVSCSAGALPPTGYKIVVGAAGQYCWDLATTAGYTTPPPILVCIHYPAVIAGNEANFQMVHDDGSGSGFTMITTDRCLTTNCRDTSSPCTNPCDATLPPGAICGFAGSLSPFALVEPIDTTGPVLAHVPGDVDAFASSTSGVIVHYALPTATDAVDGPVPVICAPAPGSTFAPRKTTVSCSASDAAGNTTTASFVVWVKYQAPTDGTFFLPPINPDGSSVFKRGSTVPVKFKLQGASAGIKNLAAHLSVAKVVNDVVGAYQPADSTPACDGDTFRYDPGAKQYIFNLATKGMTAGTWSLRADLGDKVEHVVRITLK